MVVPREVYMCKMENNVRKPLNVIFYKQYREDTYSKRKRDETDRLFDAFNWFFFSIYIKQLQIANLLQLKYNKISIIKTFYNTIPNIHPRHIR